MRPSRLRLPSAVRAGVVRGLRRHLAAYPGVSADALLHHAGIGRAVEDDPDTPLSGHRFIDFLERAARETGDPAFALRYATQLPWQDLGVLAHVALHSATVGAALGHACRYLAVQQTVGRATLDVTRGGARIIYTVTDPGVGAHAQHSESVLAVFTRLCREGTGDATWAPRTVTFRHRAPARLDAHRAFFAAPLRFGAPDDALVLAHADLRRRFRTADPGLLPALLHHADSVLARQGGGDALADVRREVIEALGRGDAAIEVVAAALGLAPRSLQRRLQQHDRSYKEVVAEARLALARRYLGDPSLTLTDVAFLLGYSDLSAFSRAYRRWTGASPQTARRTLLRRAT